MEEIETALESLEEMSHDFGKSLINRPKTRAKKSCVRAMRAARARLTSRTRGDF